MKATWESEFLQYCGKNIAVIYQGGLKKEVKTSLNGETEARAISYVLEYLESNLAIPCIIFLVEKVK